jgi:hypothetical protein
MGHIPSRLAFWGGLVLVDMFPVLVLVILSLRGLLASIKPIDKLDQGIGSMFMFVTNMAQDMDDIIHCGEILGGDHRDLRLVLGDEFEFFDQIIPQIGDCFVCIAADSMGVTRTVCITHGHLLW